MDVFGKGFMLCNVVALLLCTVAVAAQQMSAWYVLSALGFYQVCPGIPVYTLAAPRLDSMRLHLPNGRTLRIKARGVEGN